MHGTGFSRVSHSCGTLPRLIPIGSELHMLEIELYGTLFGVTWKRLQTESAIFGFLKLGKNVSQSANFSRKSLEFCPGGYLFLPHLFVVAYCGGIARAVHCLVCCCLATEY